MRIRNKAYSIFRAIGDFFFTPFSELDYTLFIAALLLGCAFFADSTRVAEDALIANFERSPERFMFAVIFFGAGFSTLTFNVLRYKRLQPGTKVFVATVYYFALSFLGIFAYLHLISVRRPFNPGPMFSQHWFLWVFVMVSCWILLIRAYILLFGLRSGSERFKSFLQSKLDNKQFGFSEL